jgi:hypothetical protein
MANTWSPTANRSDRLAMTSPTVPPIMTSSSGCGAMYVRCSFIRPRMYGSSDR